MKQHKPSAPNLGHRWEKRVETENYGGTVHAASKLGNRKKIKRYETTIL